MNGIRYEPRHVALNDNHSPIEEPQGNIPAWVAQLERIEREHGGTVTRMDANDPELIELRKMMRMKHPRVNDIEKKRRVEADKLAIVLLKANVSVEAIVEQLEMTKRRALYLKRRLMHSEGGEKNEMD
ncbi:hypothetical protein HWN39_10585 [Lactobacillus rhamnosus]|uniref:Uncharacterized protein n=1 Tax=Lacticaseibacillus rhamnosus TaxID=47715 RepID=A0A7Y7QGX8_LACRH|nr:hypothetical protein [Lacticaseibacillus rhamnosus]NVO88924.1 hypothetical protein [Lacticaseibacillus rhamnosus]